MEITRRGLLKATTIGTTFGFGIDVSKATAEMRELKIGRAVETRGTVTKPWARLHHPRWFRDITGGDSPPS
jgi:cytochrome b subunit of formate dehydrogenase